MPDRHKKVLNTPMIFPLVHTVEIPHFISSVSMCVYFGSD